MDKIRRRREKKQLRKECEWLYWSACPTNCLSACGGIYGRCNGCKIGSYGSACDLGKYNMII